MYNNFKKVVALVVGITAFGLFNTASADWSVNEEDTQNLVITLKSNPMANPEAACLAVTFANSFKNSANVTLFVTLDGVSLADDKVVSSRRFKCDLANGDEITLLDHLTNFIDGNPNNLVVCPICWNKRYDTELPDYGVLPPTSAFLGTPGTPGYAIGKMIMQADKLLDF